jgi:hypothetical protein
MFRLDSLVPRSHGFQAASSGCFPTRCNCSADKASLEEAVRTVLAERPERIVDLVARRLAEVAGCTPEVAMRGLEKDIRSLAVLRVSHCRFAAVEQRLPRKLDLEQVSPFLLSPRCSCCFDMQLGLWPCLVAAVALGRLGFVLLLRDFHDVCG